MSTPARTNITEADELILDDRLGNAATTIDSLIIEVRKTDPLCAGFLELAYLVLSERFK